MSFDLSIQRALPYEYSRSVTLILLLHSYENVKRGSHIRYEHEKRFNLLVKASRVV